jgi:nitroreductase
MPLPPPADTLALIRSRRTTQTFDGRPVDRAHLEAALDAAAQAPNHRRTRPWRFYVLGDRARAALVERNTQLVREARGEAAAQNKHAHWSRIPAMIVATSPLDADALREREDYAAVSAALQNAALYLHSAGLGAKWSTGSVTRDDDALRALGIDPAAERVVALLMVGHAASEPAPEQRSAEPATVWLD